MWRKNVKSFTPILLVIPVCKKKPPDTQGFQVTYYITAQSVYFILFCFTPPGSYFVLLFYIFFSFFTSPCRFYLFLFHIFLQGQSFHIRPHPPNPISDYQQGYYLKRLHTRSHSFDNLSYPILIHKHYAYQLSLNIVIDSQ